MLQIGKTIVSLNLIEKNFVCDLQACKGACCVVGDSGAPLEEDELEIFDDIYSIVEPYLSEEGIRAIDEQGLYTVDDDNDYITPLINNKECAYTIFENGIAKCAIEKAFFDKKINFRKPISCHLYPVRITKYTEFDAVNYETNKLCVDAVKLGDKLGVPVYKFLKEPLTKKYGEEWYKELEYAAKNLNFVKENKVNG
ncbi:MAG: DUF3109 domain-containing protein [Bacteroidetes bacterium]|nr:MAG: DUF3109 domain-containing protein [Bacteroidota bacterium]